MKKKTSIIFMIVTAIVGSFITFYSINLLMSDLSNMFYGVHDAYFVSSLPLFVISVDFVMFYIFLLRYTRYPMYKKALIKLYSTFLVINSIVGIITSILTGTLIYKSFIKPFPFPSYTLVLLTLNIILLVVGIYIKNKVLKGMEEDKEKKKIKVKYALYSGVIFLLILYAFNKFGAFIWSPIYIQTSTLYLTFPFYLSLICPIALVVHITIYFLDGYKNKEVLSLIIICLVGGLSTLISIAVLILGASYPEFISAISPCLPLERLATMPIGTVSQLIVIILFSGYYIIYSIKSLKRKQA